MDKRRYIAMCASARMPNSCKGIYRRVGLIETDGSGIRPKMISKHARHVVRVVRTWERCHAGTNGGNTAYDRALDEAWKLANQLNAAIELAEMQAALGPWVAPPAAVASEGESR